VVYSGVMPYKKVRRSVSLPLEVAKQVDRIAQRRRLSENRVLLELIEEGIAAAKEKEKQFFELAQRFRTAQEPEEISRLGDEMGRFVFGK
jgi:metal-responsive CopG/Arc/MetJ family transcriptional regulator